jgi:hypothetical protein
VRRKVNAFLCTGEGLVHPARIMQTDTGGTIYPFNAVCVYGVPEGVVVGLKGRTMMMHSTNGSPDVCME